MLRAATAPNVAVNAQQHTAADCVQRASYVSGDFESACTMLAASEGFQHFNLIITSESVYNVLSARQLLEGCNKCLSREGCVYVACKSHYFGVGGGLAKFKELVEQNGQFSWAVVKRVEDGESNVREVLKLDRMQRYV